MRATGGTLKSCQMRPIAKPSASAAKISKAITTAKVIPSTFPFWAKATTLPLNGYSILLGRTHAERPWAATDRWTTLRARRGYRRIAQPVDSSSPFLMLLLTFARSSMVIV